MSMRHFDQVAVRLLNDVGRQMPEYDLEDLRLIIESYMRGLAKIRGHKNNNSYHFDAKLYNVIKLQILSNYTQK